MTIDQFSMIFGAAALTGFVVIVALFMRIKAIIVDNEKAQQIADAIQEGAMTFLREEYKIIAIVVAPVAILLGFIMSPLPAFIFCCWRAIFFTPWFYWHACGDNRKRAHNHGSKRSW